MKVAIIADYLTQYGGAEKTLDFILQIFPEADIFTGLYKPETMSEIINKHKVIYPKSSLLATFPKYLTFLYPYIFESFDLTGYDLVISSGTVWAKSVLTTTEQLHISYIHTPPRFLYGYTVESQKRDAWYFKPFVMVIDHFLRDWDFIAAQRPDFLVANSKEVQKRIKKFYARESTVIYPPVETNHPAEDTGIMKKIAKRYYLALGRLSAYKNFDLIIKAFNNTDLNLVVAGTGKEEEKLKELGGKNIFFTGKVTEAEKHDLMENCQGFIFPVKEEDFGIVPIEAMSHGKPVLAHKSGGPLETIKDGVDGMFFSELEEKSLTEKIKEFDKNVEKGIYSPETIKSHAQEYTAEKFITEFKNFVMEKYNARTA